LIASRGLLPGIGWRRSGQERARRAARAANRLAAASRKSPCSDKTSTAAKASSRRRGQAKQADAACLSGSKRGSCQHQGRRRRVVPRQPAGRLRTVVVLAGARTTCPMTSSISSIATPPGRRSNGVSSAKGNDGRFQPDAHGPPSRIIVDFRRKLFGDVSRGRGADSPKRLASGRRRACPRRDEFPRNGLIPAREAQPSGQSTVTMVRHVGAFLGKNECQWSRPETLAGLGASASDVRSPFQHLSSGPRPITHHRMHLPARVKCCNGCEASAGAGARGSPSVSGRDH